MAGGTFDVQDKVRAGVYIRFKSALTAMTAGLRGTVAICEALSWGPDSQILTITADSDIEQITGFPITDSSNRFLREIFKGTNRTAGPQKVLLYRPLGTSAVKATKTIGNLTATARYFGTKGNSIAISVVALTSGFAVSTIVDGVVLDYQTGSTVADLTDNAWVVFTGSGALTASAATSLTGGANGTVGATQHAAFLTALEAHRFDVVIYDGTDTTTRSAYLSFIERMASDLGQYGMLVVSGADSANSRFVINVASGVKLSDGTTLTAAQTTWWVGGATAGANYNESLTYAEYPDAVEVSPVLTNAQAIAGIEAGKFMLLADAGTVKVEKDIDSLTSFTNTIGRVFSKGRTMRLCNTIANDIYADVQKNFIGVINNDESGRSRLKASIVGYLTGIEGNGGIKNFTADDVLVTAGTEPDSVIVDIAIQTMDSIEKIYITVEVA